MYFSTFLPLEARSCGGPERLCPWPKGTQWCGGRGESWRPQLPAHLSPPVCPGREGAFVPVGVDLWGAGCRQRQGDGPSTPKGIGGGSATRGRAEEPPAWPVGPQVCTALSSGPFLPGVDAGVRRKRRLGGGSGQEFAEGPSEASGPPHHSPLGLSWGVVAVLTGS